MSSSGAIKSNAGGDRLITIGEDKDEDLMHLTNKNQGSIGTIAGGGSGGSAVNPHSIGGVHQNLADEDDDGGNDDDNDAYNDDDYIQDDKDDEEEEENK